MSVKATADSMIVSSGNDGSKFEWQPPQFNTVSAKEFKGQEEGDDNNIGGGSEYKHNGVAVESKSYPPPLYMSLEPTSINVGYKDSKEEGIQQSKGGDFTGDIMSAKLVLPDTPRDAPVAIAPFPPMMQATPTVAPAKPTQPSINRSFSAKPSKTTSNSNGSTNGTSDALELCYYSIAAVKVVHIDLYSKFIYIQHHD